jgi:predicted peroxiredoxin
MRTMRQIIDIANEWLASKGYSQLSAGEVIFVVVETTKALKVFKIYKQDADILEKLIHIYACKTICELRNIDVPKIVDGAKLANPRNFKYCFATKEFINV